MKKEMNLLVLVVFGIFLFMILSVNFVLGSFQLGEGNVSYNVDLFYGPSENIKGWINISFEDESADSLLSSNFEGSINLIDFLDANLASYDCTPIGCGDDYTSINGEGSKSFSLGYGEEKIISFFISEGTISLIKELKFYASVSNNPSCISPLKIDVLNDGLIEWRAQNFLEHYSCAYEQGMGCFDSSETLSNIRIDDTPFCEKMNLIENGNFSLGAWVKKGTTIWYDGLLKMWLYDLEGFSLDSCDLPEPSVEGGKINCTLAYNNNRLQEYYVCIKAEESTDYETQKEDVEPCGFYAYPGEEAEYHDYYIFANSAKFSNIGDFIFNQEEYEKQGNLGSSLNEYVLNYLGETYGKDCSNGCSIPIKFESYGNIDVAIYNAVLDYSTGAGPQIPINEIYDTSTEKAKIDSDFQKLDLEKADLSVNSGFGSDTFTLKLNDEQILEQDIQVVAAPVIRDIIPKEVPASVSVKFTTLLDQTGNMTYGWDFGDGVEETSGANTMEHTYSSLGNYMLTVVVGNEFGNSSKTVQVNVGTPKKYINKTIKDYNSKLDSVQSEIDNLPEWVANKIEEEIKIEDLKSEIKVQEGKYNEALLDEDYIKIMDNLLQLKIPSSLGALQTIGSSDTCPTQGQINLDSLNYFGAGNIESSEQGYAIAITNWIKDNLKIVLELKTYLLYYDDGEEPLYSYFKVTLTPKQDLEDVYFLINDHAYDVEFKEDYGVRIYNDLDSGIIFSDLAELKVIEFLYPNVVDVKDLPIYVSPEFKNLNLEVGLDVCNFNKRCEKNLGENYENCRSDCKPLGKTLFWFFILFLIAFVVYIILQEWYKRYYQSHLFKNRNHLFNLINFMNNSFNQGIGRLKIFGKLKDLNWNGEQLRYAWNKLHGKRTGMWEIPIFKWVEKKEVKKELEKRKGAGVQPVQSGSRRNYSQRFRR